MCTQGEEYQYNKSLLKAHTTQQIRHTNIHTNSQTQTQRQIDTDMRTGTHIHTHIYTHRHTHKHTHTRTQCIYYIHMTSIITLLG